MSSARNWSKLLPLPGSTITPGPLGILTQPPRSSAAPARTTSLVVFMESVLRLRRDALPRRCAVLHVRIVSARIVAVVPRPGGLLCLLLRLLDVRRRLLRGIGGRVVRRIVGIRRVIRITVPIAVTVIGPA